MPSELSTSVQEVSGLHRELATAVIAFQESVARAAGMSSAERKCAGILMERVRMTPGELASATGLTTGAVTGIVKRLVRAGYAERTTNPSDRRSVIVEVRRREALAAQFAPPFAKLTAAMETLMAKYSHAELALIRDHLAATIEILSKQMKTARL